MTKPKLLDAFCCQGGASVGYSRAGFDVFGVDIGTKRAEPREGYTLGPLRRYPFDYHHGDALAYIRDHGHEYDVIHASPPCQRYSITNHAKSDKHPDLVGPVRELLIASGKPYILENVEGAPLVNPLMLCGSMFNLTAIDEDGIKLRMERHRLFETNFPTIAPSDDWHDPAFWVAGSYGGARRDKYEAKYIRKGGYVPSAKIQQQLLGIDWMTEAGMYQSLPPVYTEYVGRQFLGN